jgi:ferric-dicitrate binding protein FerR (iron transport regulator)
LEITELQALLARYNKGVASVEEKQRVEEWYENLDGEIASGEETDLNLLRGKIYGSLQEIIPDLRKSKQPAKIRSISREIKWAAACILIGITTWLYFSLRPLKPVTGKGEMAYKMISTPRGQSSLIVLPDGTYVWLNAASSIRFPESFSGGERRVEMTGEAYFEVTKNKKLPFHVVYLNQELEVLGTHFNINAYADEPLAKTTLIEGSVKIDDKYILSPGDQAQLNKNSIIQIVQPVDAAESIAWINNQFEFNEADIYEIMRQISRWYDVDAEFEGKIPTEHFTGKISHNESLPHVIQILELSGFHIELTGKKILVRD